MKQFASINGAGRFELSINNAFNTSVSFTSDDWNALEIDLRDIAASDSTLQQLLANSSALNVTIALR